MTKLIGRTHTENYCNNDLSANQISCKGPSLTSFHLPLYKTTEEIKQFWLYNAFLAEHRTVPWHYRTPGLHVANLKHRLLCWGKIKKKEKLKKEEAVLRCRLEVCSKKCAERISSHQFSHEMVLSGNKLWPQAQQAVLGPTISRSQSSTPGYCSHCPPGAPLHQHQV